MAAVQFFGKKAVVAAYVDRGIECWAVFDGRHMLNAGDDADRLEKYLNMLSDSGTAATYTLQFYRDCDDPDTIGPKDECSGSFKFKLSESSMAAVSGPGGTSTGNVIQSKLNTYLENEVGKIIEKRLSGKDDEAPEKETLSDVLMGLLREPDKLIGVINGVKNMLRPGSVGMPVTLAGTTGPVHRAGQRAEITPVVTDTLSDDDLARLDTALGRLHKCDPAIVLHLEQLANLAETKPDMYKMALTMLK